MPPPLVKREQVFAAPSRVADWYPRLEAARLPSGEPSPAQLLEAFRLVKEDLTTLSGQLNTALQENSDLQGMMTVTSESAPVRTGRIPTSERATPEGFVDGRPGDLHVTFDGVAQTAKLWVKESGIGSTGWVMK